MVLITKIVSYKFKLSKGYLQDKPKDEWKSVLETVEKKSPGSHATFGNHDSKPSVKKIKVLNGVNDTL